MGRYAHQWKLTSSSFPVRFTLDGTCGIARKIWPSWGFGVASHLSRQEVIEAVGNDQQGLIEVDL